MTSKTEMIPNGDKWAIKLIVAESNRGDWNAQVIGIADPNPKSRRQRFFRCKYVPHEVIQPTDRGNQ